MTTITLIIGLLLSSLEGNSSDANVTNTSASQQTNPQQGSDFVVIEEIYP